MQFVYDKLSKKETHSSIIIAPHTLDRDSPSASSSSSSSTFLECPSNSVHITTENINVSAQQTTTQRESKKTQAKRCRFTCWWRISNNFKEGKLNYWATDIERVTWRIWRRCRCFILQKYYSYFKESDAKKQ